MPARRSRSRACSSSRLSAKRYGDVGSRASSAARRRMPSRFIVSCAARAVGIDLGKASLLDSTSASVAIASISGTTRCGRSCSISRRSARRVGHRDDVRAVRDLMAGRVRVAVDGDGLDAESLQRDDHFLAELAAAEQHHAGGGRGERGAEGNHRAAAGGRLCILADFVQSSKTGGAMFRGRAGTPLHIQGNNDRTMRVADECAKPYH